MFVGNMKMIFKYLVTAVLGLYLVIGYSHADSPVTVMMGTDGKAYSVESFVGDGGWRVIFIWSSTTPDYISKIYSRFHLERQNDDISVLGISLLTSPGVAAAYVRKNHLVFTNLVDTKGSFSNFYLSQTGVKLGELPQFLLFSPEGELMMLQSGYLAPREVERFISRNSLQE